MHPWQLTLWYNDCHYRDDERIISPKKLLEATWWPILALVRQQRNVQSKMCISVQHVNHVSPSQRATTHILCKYLSHLGHLYVEFAMASRSSTERLGDFWKRWVSRSCLGVFLCCLLFVFCLCCLVFHWHLAFLFTYSPTCGNSQSKTKRFYDRLSFERARHGHKKKRLNHGLVESPYRKIVSTACSKA